MLSRRTLLGNTASLSTALILFPGARGFGSRPAAIDLRASSTPPFRLPADFMGLGYEMSSVASVGLLSAGNQPYVQLVKQLGNDGVMRVGGIVADYTRYEQDGTAVADMHKTVITRQVLEQFGAFLGKTNWTAIWSVNFAQGTIAEAVAEAIAVSRVLQSSLQAFEIGNEVENYARGKAFRKAPYTYEQYRAEFTQWRAAILKAVPGARFAAPDTAGSVDWVESMAKDTHGDVQLLTTHYYRNGQNSGSADQLTHPNPKLLDKMVRLRVAAQASGIPWRMCETNSFSGGGLPHVSDTLLGALWTLDFMAILAKYGCSGVNIETGVNQLGFISSYSPIQDDGNGHNTAGNPYYGMLAFAEARAGCSQAIALDLPEGQPDLTAYGFGNGGKVRSLVLVNRAQEPVDVTTGNVGVNKGVILRLTGPSSESKHGITLGSASVDDTGHWEAAAAERMSDGSIRLPAMSAAVVRAT